MNETESKKFKKPKPDPGFLPNCGIWVEFRTVSVAPTLRHGLHALILSVQFLAASQFPVGVFRQVLGANVLDRRDLVLEAADKFLFAQHVFESRGQAIDRERHRLQIVRRVAIGIMNSLFRIGSLYPQPFVELVDVLEILRHVAYEPVRSNEPFEKVLDQIGALFKYASGGGDNTLRPSVRVCLLRHNQDIAAFFLQVFRYHAGDRSAFDSALAQRFYQDARGYAAAHPFDIFLDIEAGLAQLDLDPPVADAVEIADTDSFSL